MAFCFAPAVSCSVMLPFIQALHVRSCLLVLYMQVGDIYTLPEIHFGFPLALCLFVKFYHLYVPPIAMVPGWGAYVLLHDDLKEAYRLYT